MIGIADICNEKVAVVGSMTATLNGVRGLLLDAQEVRVETVEIEHDDIGITFVMQVEPAKAGLPVWPPSGPVEFSLN